MDGGAGHRYPATLAENDGSLHVMFVVIHDCYCSSRRYEGSEALCWKLWCAADILGACYEPAVRSFVVEQITPIFHQNPLDSPASLKEYVKLTDRTQAVLPPGCRFRIDDVENYALRTYAVVFSVPNRDRNFIEEMRRTNTRVRATLGVDDRYSMICSLIHQHPKKSQMDGGRFMDMVLGIDMKYQERRDKIEFDHKPMDISERVDLQEHGISSVFRDGFVPYTHQIETISWMDYIECTHTAATASRMEFCFPLVRHDPWEPMDSIEEINGFISMLNAQVSMDLSSSIHQPTTAFVQFITEMKSRSRKNGSQQRHHSVCPVAHNKWSTGNHGNLLRCAVADCDSSRVVGMCFVYPDFPNDWYHNRFMPENTSAGVVCNSVGSGKTACALGLAAYTLNRDAANYASFVDRALGESKTVMFAARATLLVVPNHLLDQYVQEIISTVREPLNVIRITNLREWFRVTKSVLQDADIVLTTFEFLMKNKSYEDGKLLGMGKKYCPKELLKQVVFQLSIRGGVPFEREIDKPHTKAKKKTIYVGIPLESVAWNRVIMDEISSIPYQQMCDLAGAWYTRHLWGMTGTPDSHHIRTMFARSRVGTWSEMTSVWKHDAVLTMPQIHEHRVPVTLAFEERAIYQSIETMIESAKNGKELLLRVCNYFGDLADMGFASEVASLGAGYAQRVENSVVTPQEALEFLCSNVTEGMDKNMAKMEKMLGQFLKEIRRALADKIPPRDVDKINEAWRKTYGEIQEFYDKICSMMRARSFIEASLRLVMRRGGFPRPELASCSWHSIGAHHRRVLEYIISISDPENTELRKIDELGTEIAESPGKRTHSETPCVALQSLFQICDAEEPEECPVCMEPFDRSLVILSCRHFVCELCYNRILNHVSRDYFQRQNLACPICRKAIGSAQDLKVRFNAENNNNSTNTNTTYLGSKLDAIVQTIHTIPENEKILLFMKWPVACRMLVKQLEAMGIKTVMLEGTTNTKLSRLRRFRSDPTIRVMVMSGEGLAYGTNLYHANHVIVAHPADDIGLIEQLIARSFRPGQTRDVHVYLCYTEETVESQKVANMWNICRKMRERPHV